MNSFYAWGNQRTPFVKFFKALVFKVQCQGHTATSSDRVADMHSWPNLGLVSLTYETNVIQDQVALLLGTVWNVLQNRKLDTST